MTFRPEQRSRGGCLHGGLGSTCCSEQATSIRRDFQNGNYLDIVRFGNTDSWEYYASQGLIGNTSKAIAGLSRHDDPEAGFYLAASLWIGGDETLAVSILKNLDLPEATRLLGILSRPVIDVLTQTPLAGSQYVPCFANTADKRFCIKNLSSFFGIGTGHSAVGPAFDILEHLNENFNPAFYISREIEWSVFPRNLHELDCPIFGHTEDYDVHLQCIHNYFELFDKIITCGSCEWKQLTGLFPVPVCTFPKAYGLSSVLPAPSFGDRPIDLFISGTIFHPYHPDKANLVYDMIASAGPTRTLTVTPSFISADKYFNFLSRSKVCTPFVRHDGSMPTRGLEALAMGNALIVQTGSSLPAFFGEQDGVFVADLRNNEFPSCFESILDRWSTVSTGIVESSMRIRDEFSMKTVSSQYLRFLTVMAAITPKREKRVGCHVKAKRSVISSGPTNEDEHYLKSLAELARSFHHKLPEEREASDVNDLAREVLLFYAAGADKEVVEKFLSWGRWPVSDDRFLDKAILLFQSGVEMFPRYLALRFNLMRVLYHFGEDDRKSEARKIAEQIAMSDDSDWEISPLDDVLPYDFFPEWFNYRGYLDLVTTVLGRKQERDGGFLRIIRASSAHYASMAGASIGLSRLACELDPAFVFYRIALAKQLAEMPDFQREAAEILHNLASENLIPLLAWEELLKSNLVSQLAPERRAELSQRIVRMQSRIQVQPA